MGRKSYLCIRYVIYSLMQGDDKSFFFFFFFLSVKIEGDDKSFFVQ